MGKREDDGMFCDLAWESGSGMFCDLAMGKRKREDEGVFCQLCDLFFQDQGSLDEHSQRCALWLTADWPPGCPPGPPPFQLKITADYAKAADEAASA
eukprot:g69796.t1